MKPWYFWLISLLILVVMFLYDQNNRIQVSRHHVKDAKIPSAFNGFKILHISDLHNKSFGKNQSVLLRIIFKLNPDIILITGDLIDRRRTDFKPVLHLLEGISQYPVYFAPGNHEAWSKQYVQLRELLLSKAVLLLENECQTLLRDEQSITLYGLKDPGFYKQRDAITSSRLILQATLDKWKPQAFSVLLSHRPEYFDLYTEHHMDITFSGHAHGGQIRFPFIGAIMAPHQGFFPKYSAGMYQTNMSKLFLSRGLGNSLFPFRIFNHPELIFVTLENYQLCDD
jgi:predicted MPP superfamily phosphohydrolase